MGAPKVLLVDDEAPLRDSLSYAFGKEGFEVLTAGDGVAALERARESQADVIVLDLILPDRDGIDVCRELRTRSRVPIVMLTARDQIDDRLSGFEAGADDYLTKPFNTRELVARVRAVMSREQRARALLSADEVLLDRLGQFVGERPAAGPDGTEPRSYSVFTLVPAESAVVMGARSIALGAAEYRLIEALIAERGRVVTRTHLCRQIWGEANHKTVLMLDATVRVLRDKIEVDAAAPAHVLTVAGIGYQLA